MKLLRIEGEPPKCRHACHPDSTPGDTPGACGPINNRIFWLDSGAPGTGDDESDIAQRVGFLSGAERAFGGVLDDIRTRGVQDLGDEHGVSYDTGPLE